MTPPTPVPVCVCPDAGADGVGASRRSAESPDVTVLSPRQQHATASSFRYTPPTNYILKLVSSSSKAENNTNLSLVSGGGRRV